MPGIARWRDNLPAELCRNRELEIMLHLRILCRAKNRSTAVLVKPVGSSSLCVLKNKYLLHKRGYNSSRENFSKDEHKKYIGCIGVVSILGFYYYYTSNKRRAFAREHEIESHSGQRSSPGEFDSRYKSYTLSEVAKHDNKNVGIWVTYKQGVYDITDFIEKHPGGAGKIIMAAGGSIEPFWMIFSNHNKRDIYDLLESMRIGNISKEEASTAVEGMEDPYANDPQRHKILIINNPKPFNAETPAPLLIESFHTPSDLFYVRNHLPVPDVDPQTYELEIAIEEDTKKVLRLDDIKKYPKHTVSSTIMCAGNRRSEMAKVKAVKGLSWSVGAVGNATWSGAKLCDILNDLNVKEEDYEHIQFEGLDLDPSSTPYGSSIPISKAIDPKGDVILAYEMNGKPLPRDHGFPIRVVVPGVVGARNVKWLGRIIISKHESQSQWQQGDYKGFSPSTDWDTVDFSKSPAIQELPVISAICTPQSGDQVVVQNGKIKVAGYAWSGGGQKIVRVDVTIDGGDTWHTAEFFGQDLSKPGRHWSWTLWQVEIPVKEGDKNVEIWAKAVDSMYNVQPESFKNIWNLRGVLNNAYHRVKIDLK
ncbi:sulfite oxidase, mitochondrial isoform X1 [Neodiprion lecontei]|uniref:Sulfite oxidase n=1 Tax=Neodiprion lecontei TaxID=441921 RepID=A0A6J0CDG7_NEOLC|nr:sulfite oxidase, mitochondrial isoform X1 [Neodiprion lecontei]